MNNTYVKTIEYWKQHLGGARTVNMPLYDLKPDGTGNFITTPVFDIQKDIKERLENLSKEQAATLFMSLLAAFKLLLYRYSNQEEIGVTVPAENFSNAIPVYSVVDGDQPFHELLHGVKEAALQAYLYQDAPFEKVLEAVNNEAETDPGALRQFLFIVHNVNKPLNEESYKKLASGFSMVFRVDVTADGLQCSVTYSDDKFNNEFIIRMMEHYNQLLHAIAEQPGQKTGALNLLTAQEERRLIVDWNDSKVKYPHEKTIIDLFEEHAEKTPDKIALVFEAEQFTYKQLNDQANKLARYLISKGVKNETPVPVCIERSAAMIIAILGILKSGGAYVPIDPEYPEKRMGHILEDVNATVLLTSKNSRPAHLANAGTEIIVLDDWPVISTENPGNLPGKVTPNQLAYIIYTSGSTGKPKGVMIQHNSLMDYVFGLKQKIQINTCKSFALVSTISADLGNTVLYSSLAFGGTLHVFSKETINDGDKLYSYFKKHAIDCLKIVPSHWEALCTPERLLLPVRMIVFGGEALRPRMVNTIFAANSGCMVVNHYGPTETTIGKLLHVVEKERIYDKTVPIGKPFSNTKIYVLTPQMALCPIGVAGQLYIAGDGVARGYYNKSGLTHTKFIQPPPLIYNSSRMYSTGDKVQYLPDGNIEFIGRTDDQVKIRGYRIEPAGIESILMQSEHVARGVVLVKEDGEGKKRLAGYVVPNGKFDKKAIISYLQSRLPEYMVPALWVQIDHLPLTSNGKINKKALPEPLAEDTLTTGYVAPRNKTEKILAERWQDLLKIEKAGIHDNFFEMGGDSLLAIRLISAVRRDIKAEIDINSIFNYPTIATLAAQLQSSAPGTDVQQRIKTQPRPAHIPLSFSQERLWFIHRLEGSVPYHLPKLFRLKGKLNQEALSAALKRIVYRHEILRTVVLANEGEARQEVRPAGGWQLAAEDLSGWQDIPEKLNNHISELISKPFNLSKDYMLRAHLLRLGSDDHLLLITLHHIASDGWSVSLMIKELEAFYTAYPEPVKADVPAMTLQYADYAIWQRKNLQGELWNKKISFWKDQLKGVSPIDLPEDYPRPAVPDRRGAVVRFTISEEIKKGLLSLGRQQGATLFMTLLAVFKLLLYRYSNQEDICVGTAVAGRPQRELESLIGFFVNTLALRSNVNGDEAFTDLLQRVRANMLDAYSHQDVPFGKVVEAVMKERDRSRNPIFQVMFNLDNVPQITQLHLGDAELFREEPAHHTSAFDLVFDLAENGAALKGKVEYSTGLYNEGTITRMIAHYINLLTAVVKQPGQKTGLLPMLDPDEQQELLTRFNNTRQPYPSEKSIAALFEEQAASTPDNIAIEFEKEKLTYKQLNERANQFARYLQSKGVQDGTLVPVCVERSAWIAVAILGVLKAGGAYVPIDPDYPADRVHYMLEDTGAKIVAGSSNTRSKLCGPASIDIIEIDTEWPVISKLPVKNLSAIVSSDHLAYVIYTSGSTGKPKGVMIEHKSVVNFILSVSSEVDVTRDSVFLTVTTYSFDIFGLELYTPLLNGGKLIIASREAAVDGFMLAQIIAIHKPTHMQATPPTWRLLINTGWKNTEGVKVITGGEAVQDDLKNELAGMGDAWNMYGPTEATICSTFKKMSVHEKVLIGKPFANTTIYIVNGQDQLAPVNIAGELCIAGDGLARGYLNRAGLTAQRFTKDPFSATTGVRMYHTGDLCKWLPDGNIEYLGRVDEQVKVRGYRIELGEIESVALRSGLVKQVVVAARNDGAGSKRLVGYAVNQGGFDKAALIAFLKTQLPNYMVPFLWVEMDNLPLTPNGKVDKKSLPEPENSAEADNQYTAPRDEEEKMIAGIWQEVTGTARIGIHDNFFDLGGHSLLAAKIIALVEKATNKRMPVSALFEYPTVETFAKALKQNREISKLQSLVPLKTEGHKKPLYIVLGINGTAFAFIEFANMFDAEQPVYVLQEPQEIDDMEEFPDTIEEIAAIYIAQILKQNPHGPYALAGHCFGGIIAFEMAKQLEKMGKEVKLLALFDTVAYNDENPGYGINKILYLAKKRIKTIFFKLKKNIRLLYYDRKLMLKYRKESFMQFINRLKRWYDKNDEEYEFSEKVTQLYENAHKNYKITRYNGSIELFVAKLGGYEVDDKKYLGWKPFVKSIEVHEIEGDHLTMFKSKDFAGLIQENLDKYLNN